MGSMKEFIFVIRFRIQPNSLLTAYQLNVKLMKIVFNHQIRSKIINHCDLEKLKRFCVLKLFMFGYAQTLANN